MPGGSRDSSPASFASASGGESAEEEIPIIASDAAQNSESSNHAALPQRPTGLPRLQQHFGTDAKCPSQDAVPALARPEFLPPELLPVRRPPVDAHTSGDDSDPVTDSARELLCWLNDEASGAQPEHIQRIVAWLVQLLRWAYIQDSGAPEELHAPAREALAGLPDLALVRVFAEASAAESARSCGLEAHLLAFFSAAAGNLQSAEQQRATLCLLAFAASGVPPAGDSACSAALWDAGVPSWAVSAVEAHPQSPAVCLWACALLADLGVWRRCQPSSDMLQPPPEAVEVVLAALERSTGAEEKDAVAPGTVFPRLLAKSARRALQATLKGTESACRALEASWQVPEAESDGAAPATSARPGARLLTEGAHVLAETLHGLEEATGTALPPGQGVPRRLLIESACRSLASLWQGDEDDAMHARALSVLSAAAAIPSSWLPGCTDEELPSSWSHCALPALARLGCGPGGCGPGPAFVEVRTKLATMLQSPDDPVLLASCISALEGLAKAEMQAQVPVSGEEMQLRPEQLRRRRGPASTLAAAGGGGAATMANHKNSEATGTPTQCFSIVDDEEAFATWEDVLRAALVAVQEFRALSSLQAVTASFLTLLLARGNVSCRVVREAGGREVLAAADAAGRLSPEGAAAAKALALDEPW